MGVEDVAGVLWLRAHDLVAQSQTQTWWRELEVGADLGKDPEKLALGGEEREMTAFFSDIARFSSFSEKMTPTELVNVPTLPSLFSVFLAT